MIGCIKFDFVELENVFVVLYVGWVDIKEEGKGLKIVCYSLLYGSVSGDYGLLFIVYCYMLYNFKIMLESMYGVIDGKID